MQVLTEDEVRERLDPDRVIAAIESAFRDRYPSTVIPARSNLQMSGGIFLAMPCYDGAGHALGMKLVVVQEKPQRSEDRIQATYLLLDPQTGRPLAIVAANYLTDLRTAATSAVATKFLARERVKVLGVFGTGRQARAHIKVIPRVRRFEQVLVCGRNGGREPGLRPRECPQKQVCRSQLPTREPALLNPMYSAPALLRRRPCSTAICCGPAST